MARAATREETRMFAFAHNASQLGFLNVPLRIALPNTLPQSVVNTPYPQTRLVSIGGKRPYTYAIASGSLPLGMSLSSAGLISGTPTVTANQLPVSIRVTDASVPPRKATRSYQVTIVSA